MANMIVRETLPTSSVGVNENCFTLIITMISYDVIVILDRVLLRMSHMVLGMIRHVYCGRDLISLEHEDGD